MSWWISLRFWAANCSKRLQNSSTLLILSSRDLFFLNACMNSQSDHARICATVRWVKSCLHNTSSGLKKNADISIIIAICMNHIRLKITQSICIGTEIYVYEIMVCLIRKCILTYKLIRVLLVCINILSIQWPCMAFRFTLMVVATEPHRLQLSFDILHTRSHVFCYNHISYLYYIILRKLKNQSTRMKMKLLL